MGEDLSQGAKIGIILIILCALIAIVFSIMSVMKNVTSSGVEDLQSNLTGMASQKYDDYDQRTITGAQVVAAIKLFNGQPFGVYVFTNRQSNNTPFKYGLSNLVFTAPNSTSANGSYYYNYNTSVTNSVQPKTLSVKDGYVLAEYPTSTFTYITDRKQANDKTNAAYISNSAKFYSYLVKNTAGDVIGIMVDEL